MDVSLKETSICVVDDNGEIVSEGTVISEPEAIAEFIRAKAAGATRIGLETGPTTTWLWRELRALGLPVICIDGETTSKHSARAEAMSLSGRWRRRDRSRLCDASPRQARFTH